MNRLLEIKDLSVVFDTPDGSVKAVNNISLDVDRGECLAIVGESGSGKSQTFLTAMGLLADNGSSAGIINLNGSDLLNMQRNDLNKLRGNRIAMIFQDPMTALTPHMKVGEQIREVLDHHQGLGKKAACEIIREMFNKVNIPEPDRRMEMYPHELSGGLRQRVMIAMALICKPDVIIADEPTTALDVTVQAQIMDLLNEIKTEIGAAIILITHDLGVVAGIADRVAVMYAGSIVESGEVFDIFYNTKHPYTLGLLNCSLSLEKKIDFLEAIDGHPPNPNNLPNGCPFNPRCKNVRDICREEKPELKIKKQNHSSACHFELGVQ